ncbi:MAG: hypothetical protein U9O94_01815 [Nanoarchaeota archaeon]|nr:hypothetical protein [Nanoarchaeota archaeon]
MLNKILDLEGKIVHTILEAKSKDKNILYQLADKSRLLKEFACSELLHGKDPSDEDLLKVVQRSSKYRQTAGHRLTEKHKKYCNLTAEQLQLLLDKNTEIEWVQKQIQKKP